MQLITEMQNQFGGKDVTSLFPKKKKMHQRKKSQEEKKNKPISKK